MFLSAQSGRDPAPESLLVTIFQIRKRAGKGFVAPAPLVSQFLLPFPLLPFAKSSFGLILGQAEYQLSPAADMAPQLSWGPVHMTERIHSERLCTAK